MNRKKLAFDIVGHGLFWVWNLWLSSLLTLGVGPTVVFYLVVAAWMGIIPVPFVLFAISLVVLPVISMGFGLWKLRSNGMHLLTFLYGVEIPILFLLAVRVFAIHELSAPTTLVLGTVITGMLGLLYLLLRGPAVRSRIGQALLLASMVGYAIVAGWWAAITGIHVLGIALKVLLAIPDVLYIRSFEELWFTLFFSGFASFSVLVFVLCPLAMAGISARSLQLAHQHTASSLGRAGATLIAAMTLVVWTGAFVFVAHQPQRAVFEQLDAVQSDEDRARVLKDLPQIRTGLLAARLGPDRLFEGDGTYIRRLYDDLPEPVAEVQVAAWGLLMSPLLYDAINEDSAWTGRGLVTNDVQIATRRYAEVFDADMRRAERPALLHAARSTWNWRDAAADVFDIGEQRVWLQQQSIEHQAHSGGFTSVTVHDVYQNRTFDDQEIVMHFSLPEGAVVTGLSLNDSPDRGTAFHHVVAPRGAAQEIYEREVARRVDPALLEQVGPRQYRLRAFPVQARQGDPGDPFSYDGLGPAFHLWIDLVVPSKQSNSGWITPLPKLSEVRNAYWDATTIRSHTATGWLPDHLDVGSPVAAHREVVSGWAVEALPAQAAIHAGPMAVLIDSSYSMQTHREAVQEALHTLNAAGDTTVYCTRENQVGLCDDFDPASALFWGNSSLGQQLEMWLELSPKSQHLVVLTDHGTYGTEAQPVHTEAELPETWLVHLDSFPAAYDDWTLDRVMRSGGGVVRTAEQALVRMADPSIVDGWTWSIKSTDEPDTDSPFKTLAARQAIRLLDRSASSGLEHLDAQHKLAVSTSIVTHYSSMIVLVNDWQRNALKQASEGSDRFERETTDQEVVNGVPEPSTWILLVCGAGLLLGTRKKRHVLASSV